MNNKDTNLSSTKFQDAKYRTRIANFGASKKYLPNLHFDHRVRGFTKKELYLFRILKANILGTILKFVIA
mgnify:FL=1